MKRYSAETKWIEHTPSDIWSLVEAVESFLLLRLKSEHVTQYDIEVRDSQGDIMATTVSEARQRIERENTVLRHLSLTVWTGDKLAFQGESEVWAMLEANDYGMSNFRMELRLGGLDDGVVRRLKVDFDAWLARRRASKSEDHPKTVPSPAQPAPPPPPTIVQPQLRRTAPQEAPSPAELGQEQRSWWKPDFHNIRDNILATIIWVAVLALIGLVIAWLGLR